MYLPQDKKLQSKFSQQTKSGQKKAVALQHVLPFVIDNQATIEFFSEKVYQAMFADNHMSKYVPDDDCQVSKAFTVHLVNAFTENALEQIASDVATFFNKAHKVKRSDKLFDEIKQRNDVAVKKLNMLVSNQSDDWSEWKTCIAQFIPEPNKSSSVAVNRVHLSGDGRILHLEIERTRTIKTQPIQNVEHSFWLGSLRYHDVVDFISTSKTEETTDQLSYSVPITPYLPAQFGVLRFHPDSMRKHSLCQKKVSDPREIQQNLLDLYFGNRVNWTAHCRFQPDQAEDKMMLPTTVKSMDLSAPFELRCCVCLKTKDHSHFQLFACTHFACGKCFLRQDISECPVCKLSTKHLMRNAVEKSPDSPESPKLQQSMSSMSLALNIDVGPFQPTTPLEHAWPDFPMSEDPDPVFQAHQDFPKSQAHYDFPRYVPHYHSLEDNLVAVLQFGKMHQQWEMECGNLASDLQAHKATAPPNTMSQVDSLNKLYTRIVALFSKLDSAMNKRGSSL